MLQQAFKANAHEFTDADYVLHIDSDTMLTRPISPETFMNQGKSWWLYTPYSEIVCPWQKITEKFMEEPLDYEFMRRLPLFIPRWLHEELAKFCFQRHKMRLTDYIMTQSHRAFSEFNSLGALAWTRFKDKFQWINTTTEPMPDTCAIQRWSGDAFDEGIKAKCEEILNTVPEGWKINPEWESAKVVIDPSFHSANGAADCVKCDKPAVWFFNDTTGYCQFHADRIASNGAGTILDKRQAAMARARAALAAKRTTGWKPAPRGRKRKKRKVRA